MYNNKLWFFVKLLNQVCRKPYFVILICDFSSKINIYRFSHFLCFLWHFLHSWTYWLHLSHQKLTHFPKFIVDFQFFSRKRHFFCHIHSFEKSLIHIKISFTRNIRVCLINCKPLLSPVNQVNWKENMLSRQLRSVCLQIKLLQCFINTVLVQCFVNWLLFV